MLMYNLRARLRVWCDGITKLYDLENGENFVKLSELDTVLHFKCIHHDKTIG